jgi:hypothetical protein
VQQWCAVTVVAVTVVETVTAKSTINVKDPVLCQQKLLLHQVFTSDGCAACAVVLGSPLMGVVTKQEVVVLE